jgi:hypothetical protein
MASSNITILELLQSRGYSSNLMMMGLPGVTRVPLDMNNIEAQLDTLDAIFINDSKSYHVMSAGVITVYGVTLEEAKKFQESQELDI